MTELERVQHVQVMRSSLVQWMGRRMSLKEPIDQKRQVWNSINKSQIGA